MIKDYVKLKLLEAHFSGIDGEPDVLYNAEDEYLLGNNTIDWSIRRMKDIVEDIESREDDAKLRYKECLRKRKSTQALRKLDCEKFYETYMEMIRTSKKEVELQLKEIMKYKGNTAHDRKS